MQDSFWDTVIADAKAADIHIRTDASFFVRVWQLYTGMRRRPFFACVAWLRINQLLIRHHWRGSYRLRVWRQYRFANDISPYAHIGPGLRLEHMTDITIGSATIIGKNVVIYNGVTLGGKRHGGDNGMPCIGDNVIIYTGAKVVGKITIGANSEIGALSLCNKDVHADSVMYGIPPNATVRPKA